MKPAQTNGLWAPIIKPTTGNEWVMWNCVRFTKKEARASFLNQFPPRLAKSVLADCRFARVSIIEEVRKA